VSFRYASEGVRYAFLTQRNFRVHVVTALGIVTVGLWLRLPMQTWAVLTLAIGMVLLAELMNTAAETLVDLASPDYHPLAKQVKDLAAGAVMVTALVSVVVGLLLLGPPLLLRLKSLSLP
jgi:diacylglycerol kinase (ATP)